jgi:hypothetical protein
LANEAKSEWSAIAVLCGLDGVEVRVASAALTAVKPCAHTIIDFRALEALGSASVEPGTRLISIWNTWKHAAKLQSSTT